MLSSVGLTQMSWITMHRCQPLIQRCWYLWQIEQVRSQIRQQDVEEVEEQRSHMLDTVVNRSEPFCWNSCCSNEQSAYFHQNYGMPGWSILGVGFHWHASQRSSVMCKVLLDPFTPDSGLSWSVSIVHVLKQCCDNLFASWVLPSTGIVCQLASGWCRRRLCDRRDYVCVTRHVLLNAAMQLVYSVTFHHVWGVALHWYLDVNSKHRRTPT